MRPDLGNFIMHSARNVRAGRDLAAFTIRFLALVALAANAPAALAQVADDACPADVAARTVSCVSQDVSLASVDYEPGNLPSQCIAGSEIALNVRLGFVVNANANRYDIATWIAKQPGDIREPSVSGGPASCSLLVARQDYFSEIPDPPLAAVPNPVAGIQIVDEIDGDACYDTLPAARQYFAADFPDGLTVTCLPGADGSLTFQTLVSWSTQNRNNCDGTPQSFVGEVSNSKCAAGSPITLPVDVLSRLIIEKQTLPDGLADSFDFSGTITDPINGTVDITPFDLTDGGEWELTGALDATYAITETIPDGFEISSIACTNQTTGAPATVTANALTGEVSVPMSPTQFDVRCVYNNDQLPATLTVVKTANGADDTFNIDWGVQGFAGSPALAPVVATGGTGSETVEISTNLGSNTFYVREILTAQQIADGWTIESLSCENQDGPLTGTLLELSGQISLSALTFNAGDDVTCTFVNNAPAQLTVTKTAQGGDDQFFFTSAGLGAPFDSFSLTTSGGSANTGQITVPIADSTAGVDVDIVENILDTPGWNLAGITCSGTDENVVGNTVDFTLLPGDVVNCTFTNVADGRITIVKATEGGDGNFQFTTDVPGATSPFPIQTTNNTGSVSIATPPPGTYTVSEIVPNGWDLTDMACVESGTANSGPIDADTIQIIVEAGETITCTFTNTQRGAIVIRKETDPAGSDVFGFTSTSVPTTALPASFDVTAGGTGNVYLNLLAGTYTVIEDDPTPAFDLTDISCTEEVITGDGSPGPKATTDDEGTRTATINLDPGELVTCTFTNTQRAKLTIQKAITVDFDDTQTVDSEFDFTSTTLPNVPFSLAPSLASTPATADFLNLVPGTYDVAEDELAALNDGWALVNTACSDGSTVDNIVLDPGDDVTCTFTNAPLGSSTIVKNTVGGDDTFNYVGTAPFSGLSLDTSVIGGTASADFTNQLDPLNNPYAIVEDTPLPSGWALTGLGCVEMGGTDASGLPLNTPSTWDLGALSAEINADYNEMITCTFTNTLDGTITIRKETLPDGTDVDFAFTGDIAGAIRDYSTYSEELVFAAQPGTYSSTETVPVGWQITGIACTGDVNSSVTYTGATESPTDGFEPGDDTVNVTLAAGENVVCSFENTQESSITIVKQTVGGDDVFNFGSAALGSFALDTAVDPDQDFQNLLPGTFSVAETPVPVLWDLSNIVCQGQTASTILIGSDNAFTTGDTGITIDLAPGEDIVCTFENTRLVPNISILKEASPTSYGAENDVITYTFTVTNSGTAPLTNVTVTDPLPNLSAIDCGAGTNVIGALAPTQSASCSATYSITQADLNAASVDNTATATGTAPDSSTVSASNSATVSSNQVPNIQLTKVPSPTSYAAEGEVITYTLTVSNPGNVTLSNITVTDPLPGLGPIDCGGGSNVIASMAPNDPPVVCTADYTVSQDDVDAGSIANTATATGSAPEATEVSDTASATINSTAQASIAIVKTPSPTTFAAADVTITYTLAVTNNGGVTLSNVTVTDPLAGLSAVDCGGGSNVIASMAPQQVVNCTATLVTTQNLVDAGDIDNSATASGTAPDASSVSAIANATVRSTAVPAVSLAKAASPTTFAAAGELIAYTLTVTNSGDLTLSNVTVVDPLTGLSAVDCGGGSNVIASMAPQQVVSCTATLTTTLDQVNAGDIDNTASVTGSSPGEQNDVTASDSATVLNEAADGYVITKTVTDVAGQGPTGEVNAAGDTISYQITVENTGQTTLNTVDVTDPLVTLSCVPAAPAILDPGVTMTCSGTYVVVQSDIDNEGNPTPGSGLIENTATVSSDELPDQSDSVTVSVVPPEVTIQALAGACRNDVPYISWDITTTGLPNATTATVRVYGDGGNGSTDPADYTNLLFEQTDLPFSGETLWPGAAVDAQGNGTDWPGWDFVDGEWVEDPTDERVPTILVEFEVNPTTSAIVAYPPRTENCVPPQASPPVPYVDVPVNNPWALLLMMLSVLGIGWYYRPMRS